MNSKERLFARIEGTEGDRLPNLNIIMQFGAREIGVNYRDFCEDHEKLARGNIACARKYGIDIVTTMSDPMREAHDLGTNVVFPEDGVPYPETPLLNDKANIKNLRIVKPEDGKRMSETVKTIEFYKKELGEEFPVAGWVEGCFAESADLMGVTEFLTDLYADPEYIKELLEFCLEQALLYAKAQVLAGADIIGVGDAISSVAGPKMYRELARDYQSKILSSIQEMGAKTKLHICGNIAPFLDQIPYEYVDILDVDWMVPLEEAVRHSAGRSVISGNYDPVAIMLQGTPDIVRGAVIECKEIAGLKHASAAGCEIPKFTPPENLLAVKEQLVNI